MDENTSLVAKPREWWTISRDFWNDTRGEMKKVTWPGRNEVISTTLIVLAATVIFAVYLWGCDQVFFHAIDLLFSKFGASVSS